MNFKSRGIRLNEFYLHRFVIGRDDVNVMIKSVWEGKYYNSIPRSLLILISQIQTLLVSFLRSYIQSKSNHSCYIFLLIIHGYIFNSQL